MIPRSLTPSSTCDPALVASELNLPGLISALRPVTKLLIQLRDEASLLRRFTYKNKNQHKAQRWWNKTVEVDRVMHRLTLELGTLLANFGLDDKASAGATIGAQALLIGLERIPRCLVIVDKAIEVMLKAAGILEQLIASRAFLSFAVVVVSLIARLHTLTTVLSGDLTRCAATLVKLAASNNLLDLARAAIKNLPSTLRQRVQIDKILSADVSLAPPPAQTLPEASTSTSTSSSSAARPPVPVASAQSRLDENHDSLLGVKVSREDVAAASGKAKSKLKNRSKLASWPAGTSSVSENTSRPSVAHQDTDGHRFAAQSAVTAAAAATTKSRYDEEEQVNPALGQRIRSSTSHDAGVLDKKQRVRPEPESELLPESSLGSRPATTVTTALHLTDALASPPEKKKQKKHKQEKEKKEEKKKKRTRTEGSGDEIDDIFG